MRFVCSIGLALILVLGCNAKPSFVGTWRTERNGSYVQMKLRADGSADVETVKTSDGLFVKMVASGVWSNVGNDFSFTEKSISLEGIPKDKQALVNKAAQGKLNVKQTSPCAWTGNDLLTLSRPGGLEEFVRQP